MEHTLIWWKSNNVTLMGMLKTAFCNQADRKEGGGEGGSAPSALAVSKCEIWFFDTQNTFRIIVRGLKNAFIMSLTPLLYRYQIILWQSSSKQ